MTGPADTDGRSADLVDAAGLLPLHESELPSEHPLHRPRHSARQRTALTSAAVFFVAPVLALVLGVGRVGELENRRLADFPTPMDGWGMFTELPTWATDHLAFRGDAVHAADVVSRRVFGEPPQLGQQSDPSPAGPVGPGQQPDGAAEPQVVQAGYATVIEGSDGWLYLGYDVRAKCRPNRSLDDIAAQLRRLQEAAEGSGRAILIAIPPDKTVQEPGNLPERFAGQECAAARSAEFWDRVTQQSAVVDLRDPLRARAAETGRSMYFPQDSHWTFEGGLVLAQELGERYFDGLTRTWEISDGEPWTDEADLPKLLGRGGENRTTQLRISPDGGSDRTKEVASDFREPLRMRSSPATGTIDRPTAMIADSYAQFAIPFLGAAFNDITITHVDNAASEPDDVGRLLAASDVVVVEVVERHLSTGNSPLADPAVVDRLVEAMQRNPR